MVCEFCEEYQLSARVVLARSYRSFQQLAHIGTIADAQAWVRSLEEDLLYFIQSEEEQDYPRIIARARKYLEQHFHEDLSLKEVAAQVCLSPSYLSTLLKQYTGFNYTEYLTQIRIEKAKTLLKETDAKIYEISEQLGYQNVQYFNRIFKKCTGMTPLEFKNSIKG